MAITIISYIEAERIVENEINNANTIMLEHSQLLMDSGLEDVNKFIYQIGINPKIRQIMNANKELTSKDYILAYQLKQDLLTYKAITGFVKDYYIYLSNSDRILTPSGLIEKKIFFKSNLENTKYQNTLSYERWHEIIQGQYLGKYIPLSNTDSDIADADIIYSLGLPIVSSKPDAVLAVILDNKKFHNSIQSVHRLTNGWGIILDKDNQVLFSSFPYHIELSSDFQKLTNNTGIIDRRINSKEYKLSYIRSEESGWKYISVIPSEIYGQKVKHIRQITIMTILLCLLLGGIVTLLMTKRNYNSVHALIAHIERKPSVKKGLNEFKLIENIMNDTIEENDRMLVNQNKVLRSNFLARLLKGKLDDMDFISDAIKSYDIVFTSDSFAVILVYVMEFNKLFENEVKSNPEDQQRLVQFIITNIIEELAGQNNIGYVTEVDDTIACIINFRQTNSAEKKNDILRIADEAVYYIKNKFYIECMISVSGIHESALGLQVAYQEALDVMEYKIVTENKKIIVYDDMNVSHNRYDYPIKTEQYLINSIKTGELEKAKEIVDEIFENNVSKIIPSIDMLRCLMFDLVSTMLKTLPEISFVSEESFLENLDVVNRLMGVRRISEFKKEILDILTEICGYVQKNKNDKNDDLICDVIEYIKINYSDMNINVSIVAEKFSLTSSYLTKIFKEQTGEVLSNYITRIRLDESKKYLKDNDLSIKDIAFKVGYYNSNIYIRAFKKYEGVTPGAYRIYQSE